MKHPEIKQTIKVATDAVIFTVRKGALHVLLIQMKKKPFTGMWAFPGGLIHQTETSEDAAKRILKEQTSVTNVYFEELKTFDNAKRDPLRRVVSVAYFALLPSEGITLHTNTKYSDVKWFPIKKLPKLAYDHKNIAKEAMFRLKRRLQYTNVVWSLLPKEFTLTDLQQTYEVILDKELDKRNFRKRIEGLKLIEPTGKKKTGQANRPAALYRFKHRKQEFVNIV